LEAIQGKVGDLVFKRYEGHEIMTKMPDRTGIVPTANQLAQMEKFRLATVYGKSVLADAVSRAIYEDAAAKKGVPVFAVTVADFLNPPLIDEINLAGYAGKIGDKIVVRASDDLEVSGVSVVIREQGGAVLEQGAAVVNPGAGSWTYTATTDLAQGQAVSLEVSATDRPGHVGTKTQNRN
jgi:voltage-gated potassium channel Kch